MRILDAWVASGGEPGMSAADREALHSSEFRQHVNHCDACSTHLADASEKVSAATRLARKAASEAEDETLLAHLLSLFERRGLLDDEGQLRTAQKVAGERETGSSLVVDTVDVVQRKSWAALDVAVDALVMALRPRTTVFRAQGALARAAGGGTGVSVTVGVAPDESGGEHTRSVWHAVALDAIQSGTRVIAFRATDTADETLQLWVADGAITHVCPLARDPGRDSNRPNSRFSCAYSGVLPFDLPWVEEHLNATRVVAISKQEGE